MANEETLPVTDDALDSGPTEQDLLDAVIRNSDIMNEAGFDAPPPPRPLKRSPTWSYAARQPSA